MAACATLAACGRAAPEAAQAPSAALSATSVSNDARVVSLRGAAVLFQGQPVGALVSAGGVRLQKVDELYAAARADRVAWTEAHPGQPFPGAFVVELPAGASAAAFASLFFTMGHAGFTKGLLRAGGEALPLEVDLDQPRGPTPRQRVRLEVTQEPAATTLAWRGEVLDGMDLGPAALPSAVSAALPPPTRLAGGLAQKDLEAALRSALQAAPAAADRPLVVAPRVDGLPELMAVARAAEALRAEGLALVVTPRRR